MFYIISSVRKMGDASINIYSAVPVTDEERVFYFSRRETLEKFGLSPDFCERLEINLKVVRDEESFDTVIEGIEELEEDQKYFIKLCIPKRAIVMETEGKISDEDRKALLAEEDSRDEEYWRHQPEFHYGNKFWEFPSEEENDFMCWASELSYDNKPIGQVPPFRFCWDTCHNSTPTEGCKCSINIDTDNAHFPVWCGRIDIDSGFADGNWGLIAGPNSGFDEWPEWWTQNDLRDGSPMEDVFNRIRREARPGVYEYSGSYY